jgi:zinc transport system substrate-binding protein
MKAFKNLIFILVTVVIFVQMYVMFSNKEETKTQTQMLIAVSSFTLSDVVKNIAQSSVKVINILPLGVDPHSFEPTPKLMAEIEKSDLVLFNGAGLEPWTDGFSFKNKAVNVSKYVHLRELKTEEEHKDEDEHEHHKHEHHDHKGVDPHYWLDFANMQKVVLLVRDELTALSPENTKMYEDNAKSYIAMLEKLDAAYKKKLKSCKLDVVVVNHNALGYLSDAYGFKVESLSGLSPEDQPSPKDLMRVFEHIKSENISTIFFENFVSDKAIRAVANDAKVELEVFHVLGNITADEVAKNLSYEDIMYLNLEKLSKALVCN